MPDSGTARLSNRKSKTVQNEKRPGTLVRMCSGALFFVDKQSAVADIITHKGLQQIVAVNAANQRTGVLVSSDISRVLRKHLADQLVDGVIALLLQGTVNKLHNLLDLLVFIVADREYRGRFRNRH